MLKKKTWHQIWSIKCQWSGLGVFTQSSNTCLSLLTTHAFILSQSTQKTAKWDKTHCWFNLSKQVTEHLNTNNHTPPMLLYRSIRTARRQREIPRDITATLAHARAEHSFIKTCRGDTICTPHERERKKERKRENGEEKAKLFSKCPYLTLRLMS